MNEVQKTGILAAITAVVIVLAVATRPVSVTKLDEKGGIAVGDQLFKEDVIDISKAASLKITKFDENKLSMSSFEVVKDKSSGLWKIPSEYDYPADAEEQLKNATAPLTDLRILNIIEDAGRDDQALYGVIEPSEKLEAGVTGVGMLVTVGDASGKTMASLIVGKQIDKAQENLHYVRIPNQDPIYTVEIDPAVFDTNFKKWIKPDLLQVKSFDIAGIGIRDYQIERTQTGGRLGALMSKAMEADMTYNAGTSKWNLDRLVTFEGEKAIPVEIGEGEELKSDKLNALRTAAQSLQIVGVRPKPKGLAADLKADKSLLGSDESMLSLFEQGFIPQPSGDTTEIFAVAGETLLTTQDGVRYTLRFGEESVPSGALESESEDTSKPESTGDKRERYLLVTASLDDSRFPPPELQVVPETIDDLKKLDAEKAAAAAKKSEAAAKPPAGPGKPAEPTPTEEPNSDSPATETPAEQPEPDAAQPEETQPEETPTGEAATEEPKPEEDAAEEADEPEEGGSQQSSTSQSGAVTENDCGPVAQDEAEAADDASASPASASPGDDDKAADEAPASADAVADEKAAGDQTAEAQAAEAKPAAPQPAAKVETEEELKDRLSVVQGDITKANQRLLDARNEKINAARKKVQELNARFADWYYLIEEASFKQLMLKKDELVGPKGAPTDGLPGAGPGAPGGAPGFQGLPSFGPQ